MCGIAGFHLKNKVNVKQHDQMELFADLLLSGIEARGRQATGFVAVTHDGKQYEIDKRAMNAKDFIKERKRLPSGTRTFLGHTRYATRGSNENHANLHPVISGTCLTTHNGGVWNDDDLFKEHKIKRIAEVDTEIISALIHKVGWENAAEALHELRGSFAIASVDLRHPGEVLLAKGDWSPLYWIETSNFIVWASTDTVIRNAWEEVLGTPPMFNKFSKLDEGDILWIKGKVIEPAKFELPTYPFRRSGNPEKKTEYKSGQARGGSHMRPIFERTGANGKPRERSHGTKGSTSFARGVIPDRSVATKQLRADGYGKAILSGHMTFPALKKITGGLNPIFQPCGGCNDLILEQSFVYRTGEGKICTDCNYVAEYGSQTLKIDEGTLTHFNSWARKETAAHTQALYEVSKASGLTVQAVDYLVFRAPEKYLNDHPAMAELAEKLDGLYQEAYSAAFDNVLDTVVAQRGSEDEPAWVPAKDNVHPLIQKNLPITCATCKKFKKENEDCSFCARVKLRAEDKKEDTLVKLDTCWCGEGADVIVGGIVAFCLFHYNKCNEDNCEYGISKITKERGVVAPANHLLMSGKRVCHNHARSQKGAFSDTTLSDKGVVVRDVVETSSVGGL